MYLGVAPHSGGHLIGTWNGDVVRTRSNVRVVESTQWSAELGHRLKGTPALPVPCGNEAYDRVERNEGPQAMSDFEQLDKADQAVVEHMSRCTRITRADPEKYGLTDRCLRCEALRAGIPEIPPRITLRIVDSEYMVSGNLTMIRSGYCWADNLKIMILRMRF